MTSSAKTLRALQDAVVRAANRMIDRRGFMLPDQLGIMREHNLFCERRNHLEKAIANYRAHAAALKRKRTGRR